MFCKNCGNELSDEAMYCEKCGNKIEKENEKKKIKIKNNWKIIISLLLIVAITVSVTLIVNNTFSKKNNNKQITTKTTTNNKPNSSKQNTQEKTSNVEVYAGSTDYYGLIISVEVKSNKQTKITFDNKEGSGKAINWASEGTLIITNQDNQEFSKAIACSKFLPGDKIDLNGIIDFEGIPKSFKIFPFLILNENNMVADGYFDAKGIHGDTVEISLEKVSN